MQVEGGPVEGAEWGNAAAAGTADRHWVVGFSDLLKTAPLRHVPADSKATGVCLKWGLHPAGDPGGRDKPVSTGRTISLLANAGGLFRLRLWRGDGPVTTVTFDEPGDFAAWGEGISHEWDVLADATVVTLRWSPET